jgi:hypothetical protein
MAMRHLFLALLLIVAVPARADTAHDEIDHLRAYLYGASCRFVRNGTEYDTTQAVAHVDQKARSLGSRIHSAEDWIENAASSSSLSGKPYLVRCGGAADVEAGPWFRDELKRWRERQPALPSAH